jgi:hypothetical protein
MVYAFRHRHVLTQSRRAELDRSYTCMEWYLDHRMERQIIKMSHILWSGVGGGGQERRVVEGEGSLLSELESLISCNLLTPYLLANKLLSFSTAAKIIYRRVAPDILLSVIFAFHSDFVKSLW